MTSKTLLIVDDDLIFLRVLARAMSAIGYRVLTAESIEAAKEQLVMTYPDYAIVDLHLGADNGNDLIELLSSHFPRTRSLVLSGYANIPNAVASVRLGAGDCLPKPVDAEEIDRALRRMNGEKPPTPENWKMPDEVRMKHIVNYWEKNDRNVSETARKLNMHRRTLQRLLRRAGVKDAGRVAAGDSSRFKQLRRRYMSQANSVI